MNIEWSPLIAANRRQFDDWIDTDPEHVMIQGNLYATSVASFENGILIMESHDWNDPNPDTPNDALYGIQMVFSVSEVPVPAAAWLFGSALLGLAGIKRKK